jgi:hypothetical protein
MDELVAWTAGGGGSVSANTIPDAEHLQRSETADVRLSV